jgi:hypothetical protein
MRELKIGINTTFLVPAIVYGVVCEWKGVCMCLAVRVYICVYVCDVYEVIYVSLVTMLEGGRGRERMYV